MKNIIYGCFAILLSTHCLASPVPQPIQCSNESTGNFLQAVESNAQLNGDAKKAIELFKKPGYDCGHFLAYGRDFALVYYPIQDSYQEKYSCSLGSQDIVDKMMGFFFAGYKQQFDAYVQQCISHQNASTVYFFAGSK